MPIYRNQDKRVYVTRRTVTWERYALELYGFHEVYYALYARSNSQSDFCGEGPLFLERVILIIIPFRSYVCSV